jgi:hypothetical protein
LTAVNRLANLPRVGVPVISGGFLPNRRLEAGEET